jgi:hypothetical protein
MAVLNFSFTPDPVYTGIYRAIAYKSSAPTVPVSQQDFNPPHPNPVVGVMNVATFEEHIVKVFARLCNDMVVATFYITPPVASCPSPTNVNFLDAPITANSATVSWNPPAVAPALGYEWELFLFDSNNITFTSVATGTTLLTSVALTGLLAGRHYSVNVRSKCSSTLVSTIWSNYFDTAAGGKVIFRNSLSGSGGGPSDQDITSIKLDGGSNILSAPILVGADLNYGGVTTGSHQITVTIDNTTNGTAVGINHIRAGVTIATHAEPYAGPNTPMFGGAVTFQPNDIFELYNPN